MNKDSKELIQNLAKEYNNLKWFNTDPIIFPRLFLEKYNKGEATLQDVEISALLSANLAWGRREMVVRDCNRMFEEMNYQPLNYIMQEKFRNDNISLHRTIKWADFAKICTNLKTFYTSNKSLEILSPEEIRIKIFGQKLSPKAANKKIHMFRRWMVRDDGIVDLGIWKSIKPLDLIIPLDVHVHRSSLKMKLTSRMSADIVTAQEITNQLKKVFPNDPCLGDYALFGAPAAMNQKKL